jgi:hypothetical protein
METINELKTWCTELQELEKKKKEIKKQVEEIQNEIDERERVITAYLQNNQLERFDFGTGLVYTQQRYSVVMEDEDAFKTFAGEDVCQALKRFNSSMLNSWYKQEAEKALENGMLEYKPQGLRVTTYYNLNLRKN